MDCIVLARAATRPDGRVSRLRSLVDALWYALLTACLCAVLGLVGYGLVGYGLAALLDWII